MRPGRRGALHFGNTSSHRPMPASALGWPLWLRLPSYELQHAMPRTATGSSGQRRAAVPSRRTSCGPGPRVAVLASSGGASTRPSRSWIGSARGEACGRWGERMPTSRMSRRNSPKPSSEKIGQAVCWRRPGVGVVGLHRPNGVSGARRGASRPAPPCPFRRPSMAVGRPLPQTPRSATSTEEPMAPSR